MSVHGSVMRSSQIFILNHDVKNLNNELTKLREELERAEESLKEIRTMDLSHPDDMLWRRMSAIAIEYFAEKEKEAKL